MNTQAIQWIQKLIASCTNGDQYSEVQCERCEHSWEYRDASCNRWVPWVLTITTITEPQTGQLSRLFQILGGTGDYRNYFRSLLSKREFLHRSTINNRLTTNCQRR